MISYLRKIKNLVGKNRLLVVFLLCFFAYEFYYANNFYVPDSDFFDYRLKAISFLKLELPENIKRPPLYSALIGVFSLFLPFKQNMLYAAEGINLIASVVSLVLIYGIAKRFVGRYALLVVWLTAINPITTKMTVKPKAEILTLLLILIAIYLHLKEHKGSYGSTFLASMTRYEGALLIPIFVLRDFLFKKRRGLTIGLGLLSSTGVMVWLLLNNLQSESVNPYGMYFNPEKIFEGLKFIQIVLGGIVNFTSSIPLFKVLSLVAVFLGMAGFYGFFSESIRRALPVFLFLLGFVGMHFFYPFNINDYTVMINWILYMAVIGGLVYGFQLLEKMGIGKDGRLRRFLKPASFFFLFLLLLENIFIFKNSSGGILGYIIFSIFIFGFLLVSVEKKGWAKTLTVAFLMLIFCFLGWRNIALAQRELHWIKFSKAESRLVGEWYDKNYKAGDKMVMVQPLVAYHYTHLIYERSFEVLQNFQAENEEEFIEELKEKGVTYVVWDSHYKPRKNDVYYEWRYRNYKLFLISKLAKGVDIPHFKLVKKLTVGPRYAYIYKFVP